MCRIVWGLLYDRFGYRSCVIFIGTCVTLGVSGLPLLEYLGEVSIMVRYILFTPPLQRLTVWRSPSSGPPS